MHQQPGAIEHDYQDAVDAVGDLVVRIWDRDHTVWQQDPTEVANRLGWLDAPTTYATKAAEYAAIADGLVADGITDVLLVGMGGSSLYPMVLAELVEDPKLDLHVLDTTHPDAVARVRDRFDPATWAVVASSKSGGTLETRSLLARFHTDLVEALGADDAGRHVIAITDPGSALVDLGAEHGYRDVVINDPDIGGRFSALSAFGMVPAALLGIDVAAHARAATEMVAASTSPDLQVNEAARLGAFMGAAALAGRHQLTVVFDDDVSVFGMWIEQLVAESTGKAGTGLLPVVNEPLLEPVAYGPGRIVVAVGEHHGVRAVAEAGIPTVTLPGFDLDTLAREVFRWEFATAVAGAVMGINAFDQPNVQAAKAAATRVLEEGGGDLEVEPAAVLVDQLSSRDFLCLLAYVDPDGETAAQLESAAATLRRRHGIPVTVGVGPRYLHSTGQLHKGGPDGGVFAVMVEAGTVEVDIPGRDLDFGTLVVGQAAGDLQALRAADRTVAVVELQALLED